MAITNYGFGVDSTNTEGEIGVLQWAQMASYLGAEYAVLPPGAPGALSGLNAYLPNSGDRRIDIQPGAAVAHGTFTISDTTVPITLAASPAGERWYIVGLRRDWATFGANVAIRDLGYGATIAAALATRNKTPGVLDDQPIWAARVVAGQSGIAQIVDLRAWGSGSHLAAASTEVLNYLGRRGTRVQIGNTGYTRVVDGTGVDYWFNDRGEIIRNQPFNPSPANVLIGSGGIISAGYSREGSIVAYDGFLTLGTGFALSALHVDVALPIAPLSQWPGSPGNWTVVDQGRAFFLGQARFDGGRLQLQGVQGTSPMFQWSAGDQIHWSITYRVA